MITKLNAEQKAKIPEYVKKWTDIGLSTEPANRPAAEQALKDCYRFSDLNEPEIYWLPCPISALYAAIYYAYVLSTGMTECPRQAAQDAALEAVKKDRLVIYSNDAVRGAVLEAVEEARND